MTHAQEIVPASWAQGPIASSGKENLCEVEFLPRLVLVLEEVRTAFRKQ